VRIFPGANIAGAMKPAEELGEDASVVTVLPDSMLEAPVDQPA
jgi:cysteine synthase